MGEFSGALAEGGLDLVDELFQPFGGGRPLRLLGRQLVRGLPDLLRRGVHLVRGRLLLLGGQDRLLQHRRRRRHQLAHLTRLPDALLGRHDRRVRLILDPGDDRADRLGRAHRPFRQLAHLGRHHGEPLSGLTAARACPASATASWYKMIVTATAAAITATIITPTIEIRCADQTRCCLSIAPTVSLL
jgi:hypothetical protein